MSFHKDHPDGFLAQSSEASVLGRDVNGDLDLGSQGGTQVVSSPLCPRSLIRRGKWAKEQNLAAGFHKAGFPWEPDSPRLPVDTASHRLSSVLVAFGWFYRYDGKFPTIRKVGQV